MRDVGTFAERLSPDTVTRLERAARHRLETAEILQAQGRRLAALYLYGYNAEICLSAAYYRSSGIPRNAAIDRDTRQRRMAQARQLRTARDEPLMNSDPHSLVGWARFLEYQRRLGGGLSAQEEQRLREAVNKSVLIYCYWRPELRYKTIDIQEEHLQEVRQAARWLVDNQEKLQERRPCRSSEFPSRDGRSRTNSGRR